MSDFELNDYEDIQGISEYDPDFIFIRINSYDVWRTKDGREIKIKDIDNDHLINIVKYINKKHKNIHKWIKIFNKEIKNRKIKYKKGNEE